ncbi:unnamed protein product [Sphagnum jensenii]|uniref:Uncharacterized protein n=1 Tax=Sphagnum jensenii TaxID=128206 RepID=A0ABP1AVH0_9BRYO
MLNVEEHNRSMDEGEAGLDQGGTVQHSRNLQVTNIRQSSNTQRMRSLVGHGRHEGGEHLCQSRLHSNQGSMEPRKPNLEKSRRTWNELSYIKHEMQGSHHSQHPLASS